MDPIWKDPQPQITEMSQARELKAIKKELRPRQNLLNKSEIRNPINRSSDLMNSTL